MCSYLFCRRVRGLLPHSSNVWKGPSLQDLIGCMMSRIRNLRAEQYSRGMNRPECSVALMIVSILVMTGLLTDFVHPFSAVIIHIFYFQILFFHFFLRLNQFSIALVCIFWFPDVYKSHSVTRCANSICVCTSL